MGEADVRLLHTCQFMLSLPFVSDVQKLHDYLGRLNNVFAT
jgi:hypothetical protein